MASFTTPPRKTMASTHTLKRKNCLDCLDKVLKKIVKIDKIDDDMAMVDRMAESPLNAKIGGLSRALKKAPKKDTKKKAPKKDTKASKKNAQRHCRVSDVVVSWVVF